MLRLVLYVCGLSAAYFLGCLGTTAYGQTHPKKQLTAKDYGRWHTLYSGEVSPDGKWISYLLRYPDTDTLFVKNTRSGRVHRYPKSTQGRFIGDSGFACLNPKNDLQLLNLKNGTVSTITGVMDYQIGGEQPLLILRETIDGATRLCVRRASGQLLWALPNLLGYQLSHDCSKLLYCSGTDHQYSGGIVRLDKKIISEPIAGVHGKLSDLRWSEHDGAVAFYIENEKGLQVGAYQLGLQPLRLLDPLGESMPDKTICSTGELPLRVSDDGTKVFFAVQQKDFSPDEQPLVQVWNGNAPFLYPQIMQQQAYNKPSLALWNTHSNTVKLLNNPSDSWIMVSGNNRFTLGGNPSQYEPQYRQYPDMDYYITDLTSGERRLLAQKISTHPSQIGFSAKGDAVAYYKSSDWWIYDTLTKEHRNLTAGLHLVWDNTDSDPANELAVYGLAGWSADGKHLLVYDQFDLWCLSLDGSTQVNLTRGRKTNRQYRIYETKTNHEGSYSGHLAATIDLHRDLIFSVRDIANGATGYRVRGRSGTMKTIVLEAAEISDLQKAEQHHAYFYKKQRFDLPPEIIATTREKAIVKSNPQHQHYAWGHSEMIHYQNKAGKTLQGALFYPADYNPQVQYPMVVFIYEVLSGRLHRYVNPSMHSGYGFNTTAFTSKGYFVLMPDIAYEVGQTGIATTDCVSAAVKKVLGLAPVDPKKVGLYGHSFGGYETNFIVTQTDLFAAAVSGAGVSDVQRDYFTLNEEYLNAEAWRFENQQYRMGTSFYDRQDAYLQNSPINQAEGITTPLLLWTGLKDNNVKPEQTIAFFIGLKRLGKPCVLLAYPEQGHILTSSAAQEDLNKKVVQWFDHFLKQQPSEWIQNGTQ